MAKGSNEEKVARQGREQSGEQAWPPASVYRRDRDAGEEQDERR